MGLSQRGRPEINITPLIDVLLVLIVIFLIVIPHLIRVEEVTVPPDGGGHIDPVPALVITVKPDLSVVITDEDQQFVLEPGQLTAGLREHLRDQHHVVFVEFEEGVVWNEVVGTIDSIRGASPTTQVALKVRE
jgi:biopolymer transport protein TolR